WPCLLSAPLRDGQLPSYPLHRLPGSGQPPEGLRSPPADQRSAPGKWRFDFLSLLSRHIYWSWFRASRANIATTDRMSTSTQVHWFSHYPGYLTLSPCT